MKLFLLKLSLFLTLCGCSLAFILMQYGGYTDYFYEKFTTPKATSMIIGDSRSLQGIQPDVMNQYFEEKGIDMRMFNYSFTIAQAVIGPLYNQSILKKIDKKSKDGLFIISITPEMLTSFTDYDNTKGEFREQNQPPHNMHFVDVNPNFEYVYKNYSFFHFKGLFRQNSKTHKNGWLEEGNLPRSKEVYDDWKKHQIDLFLEYRDQYYISDLRINSLEVLINELKELGTVYLVRMPIGDEFLILENKYYPKFDEIITTVSNKTNTPYFDFNEFSKLYYTYDGHHMNKLSGKEFTLDLCELIEEELTNN
ncbi:hypothetical protein [Aquimarina algicola]|uniref:SGNH/GDSL hydrolase family protein n=1 Tax=Aquimarina algicola TaxID=2589995 RepID=A0A504JK03_9FLAO|nr:hypothetical protein [Aquimarina algicola]TPN89132.1 hypothetical protein FHK87_02605 [Aquimarina algicola]